MLSSNYTSFSMFGLCFTYAVGLLLIVASYVTEPIFSCLYRRYKFREYAHLEWTTNAILHLQRMAHQGVDSGSWTRQMDNIPTTKHGEILAELPMRATATESHDVPGKSSTTDRTGQTQKELELDSLIDSDNSANYVLIPHDLSDRAEHIAIPQIHDNLDTFYSGAP